MGLEVAPLPLYEYQCPKCGRFELIQKTSETLSSCPTCGSEVQKLLSAPAIQFKGTGWYITDYARKPEGKGGKSDKSEGGGEGGKSEGGKSEGRSDGGKSDSGKSDSGKSDSAKPSASSSGDKAAATSSSSGSKDTGGSSKT